MVARCHQPARGEGGGRRRWRRPCADTADGRPGALERRRLHAVGGDSVSFVPAGEGLPLGRRELAAAEPDVLVHFYAPVYVQQRVESRALRHPYPPEYDALGTAHLRRDARGKLKSYVAGPP